MTGPKALIDSKHINTKPDLLVKGRLTQIKAHRISFFCISPYFQRFFKHNPQPNIDGYYEVTLRDVSTPTLSQICNYSSVGVVDIDEHNVFELLSTADEYNIKGIINLCKQFLSSKINRNNCFDIYISAHYFNCEDLKESVVDYILVNNLIPNSAEKSCPELTIDLIIDIWRKQNIQ